MDLWPEKLEARDVTFICDLNFIYCKHEGIFTLKSPILEQEKK